MFFYEIRSLTPVGLTPVGPNVKQLFHGPNLWNNLHF